MVTLQKKLVFHIPLDVFADGRISDNTNEAMRFLKKLERELEGIGHEGWYVSKVRGYYRGREYTQMNMTLFCAEQYDVLCAIEAFKATIQCCDAGMRQETYAYEMDEKLYIITPDELKKYKKGV